MITTYFQEIQEALAAYTWVQSVTVLRCDMEETDREQILVYRFRVALQWDNAPHFPELQGFPHHVHMTQEDHVLPGHPMTALEMLTIVDQALSEP